MYAFPSKTAPAWRALFSGLLLAGLLIGCAPESSSELPVHTIQSPTPFPDDVSVPQRIQQRGYLIVGIRYDLPPFCYVTGEGDVAGFEVDMGHELARRWLGDAQAVRFEQVRSDTASDHLRAGRVDLVLAALIHTQEREEQVDFSFPYYWDGHALLIHASDAVSITAPSDLAGRPVGVVAGSGAEGVLLSTVPFTPTLYTYEQFDQALAALQSGEIDALTDLRRRLVRGLADVPDAQIVGQYTRAPLASAYAEDTPGLSDLVNVTLWHMLADGTYAELYGRWFSGDDLPVLDPPPGGATYSLAEAAEAQPDPGTIASLEVGGRLRVVMVGDRPPFAYVDDAGEPAGYEVQLVRAMARRWMGDQVVIEFIPVPMETGMQMVSMGEAHLLIGAIPHTQDGELEVDYSLTTYVAGEGLMTRVGVLGGVADLDGQSVAVVEGTGSADVLRWVGRETGISVIVLSKPNLESALEALQNEEVAGVVGERIDLLWPAYSIPGVTVTADRLTWTPLALALPPGDSDFRDLVNLTLQAMARDGELASIYGNWFDDQPPELEPWPGEPAHALRIEVTATTPYTETAPGP